MHTNISMHTNNISIAYVPYKYFDTLSASEKVIQTFLFSSGCLSKQHGLLNEQFINFSRVSAKQVVG